MKTLLLRARLAALLGAVLLLITSQLQAAFVTNFTVTKVADSGPGSLREAVLQANASGTSNLIQFAAKLAGKTIRLTSGMIVLESTTTIDASALPGGIRIDGNQAGRVFAVAPDSLVVLDSLTITNGAVAGFDEDGVGGGILNLGVLEMNRCTVTGNSATLGGGIFSYTDEARLTLNDCTVSGNSAGIGGGILNIDSSGMTLNRCTVSGNSVAGEISDGFLGNSGGGLCNFESELTLNQCTVSSNSAQATGGGLYNSGLLSVNQSTVSGNTSRQDGGGIYSEPDAGLILFNSIVAGNTQSRSVVGIQRSGNAEERNALSNTLAGLGFEVLLINPGEWGGLSVVISNPGQSGSGPNNTEIGNGVNYIQISDHGSEWTPKGIDVIAEGTNITVALDTPHPITSGLPASWTALGFWRYGYDVEDFVGWSTDEGLPSLARETSVANESRILVADSIGSGKAVYIGWNVYGPDAGTNDVAVLRNAILWAGPSIVEEDNVYAEWILNGVNFLSGDPRLSPLGNYGGPTQTMPPLSASPVIDAGSIEMEFATDQRGFPRFVGGAPDIGAVESSLPCLRAYYSFDNQTAIDETGNSTATSFNGEDWRSDHLGNWDSAAEHYGSEYYLVQTAAHPGNANLDLGLKGSFTVSAWIYPTDTSGDRWVLGNTGPDSGDTLRLGLSSGRAYFELSSNGLEGNQDIPANQWTHLTWTYDLQGGQIAIFVNGQLDASSVGYPNNLGDRNLQIGGAMDDGSFYGRIDDLAIYCQALAPNQIAALASDSVKPNEQLPSADLPLPAPNGCVWSVREIYAHPVTLIRLPSAEYIAHTAWLGTFIDYQSDVINFADPQTNPNGDGFIRGDRPYRSNNLTPTGLVNGNDEWFVLAARTTLVITEEDDYTFGFSSDDGARLRVKGAIFKSSTRLNSDNSADPAHRGDTLIFPGVTGDSATLGVTHLVPGSYEVEFLTWEVTGGAFCEVIYARGAKTEFDSSFQLLGYAGPSTLTATVTPFVQFITNGTPRTVQFTVQADGFGVSTYQWLLNGTNLPGATLATLTINNATPDNAGTYSARVTNGLGGTVSGPALLITRFTVGPDNQKPSLTITSPAPASLRVLSNSIRLAGIASDNVALQGVYVATGSGPYKPATGSTNWSLTLPLAAGTNVFRVVAVDAAGNVSKPKTRTVYYAVPDVLTVTVSPGGAVAPNLDGKVLEVGRNYSMRATAAKGYVFSNWTGGVLCSGPLIKFPMSSGLALQANFVRNPFAKRAGSYNGLFHETAAVQHDRSGFFTGKVTDSGGFSGYVKLDGKRLPVSGRFDLGGNATNLLKRTGTNALRLELQFDPNDPPRILGRLTDGNWIANLIADLAPSVPKGKTVPLAGKYTFEWFRKQTDTGAPDGGTVGSLIISSKGQATLMTCFADGAVTTQSVPMPTNGPIPFYVDLYKGKGSALGWLYVTKDSPVDYGAVFGRLNWYRPALPGTGLFMNGFEYQAEVFGSSYEPPASKRMLNFTNAVLIFTLWNSVERLFTNVVVLGPRDKVVTSAPDKVKLTVNLANGLFSGSTTEPGTGRTVKFKGAVFQDGNYIDGWFLLPDRSGWISFRPPEPGAAAGFNGVNDYVSIATTGSLSGPFTVELWARPSVANQTLALFGSRVGGNNSFNFKFSAGGRIHGDIGDHQISANATFAWTSNVWYHIAYVVTTTGYMIYVNGVLTSSGAANLPVPLLYDSSDQMRIGDTGGGDPKMKGYIDEVRIWSTARTAAQIQANLGRPLVGDEPGLRGYWRFDDYDTMGLDSSGHGFNAIFNGADLDYPYPQMVPFGL